MNPLEPIFRAWLEGHAALLVTGRSLYDLTVDGDAGKLRPLLEVLRRVCREEHGMALVTYSMATGVEWEPGLRDDNEKRRVRELLQAHNLVSVPQDENEVVRVIRGVSSLCRTSAEGARWPDGKPLRFCFLFQFGEHLTPRIATNGAQSDNQMVAVELAHITAQSLALRSSGNLVLFQGREGLVDDLVRGALRHIRLAQPLAEEKQAFLTAASALYNQAKLAPGLDAAAVVHLTSNTPNRGLESLLRASHRASRPLTAHELVAQKSSDVGELSEGTLAVLDTVDAETVELHGINAQTPLRIIERYAAGLRKADRTIPANVLLAGPPGTGKTVMGTETARRAGVSAFRQFSPKDSLVGETERKARLQQDILMDSAPNLSFVDEITESLPLERSDFDGDSGASKSVTAALLTALGNESRRGRSLLVATTNCPWRMGAAMRSRFTVIPVLHPAESDYPGILGAMVQRLNPGAAFDPKHPRVAEAARLFYAKGANPREVYAALSAAVLWDHGLGPDAILNAAEDLEAGADLVSAIYADLWAIHACRHRRFYPWSADPGHYPYPAYLREIVDPATGAVNRDALAKRIEEYQPHAKL